MKRNALLLLFSTLTGLGILFFNVAANITPAWLLATQALAFAVVVGTLSEDRGWLLGALAITSIYATLFLLVTFFVSYSSFQLLLQGESVIDIFRLNTSVNGLNNLANMFVLKIFFPSAAIGIVGGALGGLLRINIIKHDRKH